MANQNESTPLAIRMGLRYVRDLRAEEGTRIETAAREQTFTDIRDFRRRTRVSDRALHQLAEAGFFEPFERSRRDALWQVQGIVAEDAPELRPPASTPHRFQQLTKFEQIAWDYRTTDHSSRGHLLEPLRSELRGRGLPDAATVARMPDGTRVRYAGIVICRQRPGTASGVVFMTLEDETGFVNLVLWPDVFERFGVIGKTCSFLGVNGRIQSQDSVVHIVADTLWRMSWPLQSLPRSRDFH